MATPPPYPVLVGVLRDSMQSSSVLIDELLSARGYPAPPGGWRAAEDLKHALRALPERIGPLMDAIDRLGLGSGGDGR